MAYPVNLKGSVDFDTELVKKLDIVKDAGMTDSQAVSRYFNSGCNGLYGGVIYV